MPIPLVPISMAVSTDEKTGKCGNARSRWKHIRMHATEYNRKPSKNAIVRSKVYTIAVIIECTNYNYKYL